jgi:outer membrane protein assembly factor BamB
MRSRHILILLAAALALSLRASTAADTEKLSAAALAPHWPQWRGPNRDEISPDRGLLKDWNQTAPQLDWSADGMGAGFASISLANGRIYTTGNFPDGQAVVALGLDGKVLWTKKITNTPPKHSHEGSRCTPSIDGELLFAIASSGKIACLKTENGDEVWSRDFQEFGGKMMSGWGFSESPLVDGDRVLCTPGGKGAMIVALDKRTGKDIWRSAVPEADIGPKGKDGAGYSGIVISNGGGVKQYVQLVGRGVIGVRASDGKYLWSYNGVANKTANIPTPVVSGDYIFCSTGYQTGSALLKLSKDGDGVSAEEQYFLDATKLQNHHGGMVLRDGYIYCGHKHNNGLPICVELATGKVVWGGEERGPGTGSAAVTYADGNLIFRYQSGEVALIEASPSGYKLKGSFKPEFVGNKPCWAHPVVIGGRLYLRDQDTLMCYDVRG